MVLKHTGTTKLFNVKCIHKNKHLKPKCFKYYLMVAERKFSENICYKQQLTRKCGMNEDGFLFTRQNHKSCENTAPFMA